MKKWLLMAISIGTSLMGLHQTSQAFEYKDFSINKSVTRDSCLMTIDIRINEKISKKVAYDIDIHYPGIRRNGPLIQVYYSNILGKASWFPMSDTGPVVVHVGGIALPISKWVEQGMKTDGSWWVRVVALYPERRVCEQ